MYELHTFAIAANSFKPVVVAEELGIDYEHIVYDPQQGEHKNLEQIARHPLGKVPTMTHDDKSLFESASICRYLATVENSELLPTDTYKRAEVEQWMDFFSKHLGRWTTVLYFEKKIKPVLGREADPVTMDEAMRFGQEQAAAVDRILGERTYLCGDTITLADIYAYAYMRYSDDVGLSLDPYPNLKRWHDTIKARPRVAAAEAKFGD
jgi:glutathione S-transferase